MCCFGMASGSPPLHSRPSVPPRVIDILPPTYSSNLGTTRMPIFVEPYIHRTIVPMPHGRHLPHQSPHHPLHNGNLAYRRQRSFSLHHGSKIHHAGGSNGLGGRWGSRGAFSRRH
ncbi:hypothetical protein BcDW1_1013 [Botrytis cinerea BcDW1]|uniref:Uncharacterized protein n=1 Tax=Botryotinia fuckeliana (strain BcDW1) TaxID=1290391 RepID=M7UT63_BOTF1|nr:hypothetical protein BcDW1_1013 [Botrytis cinerea BcDW1]